MSSSEEFCVVYVTTSSEDEARRLARSIVERRLAACANIVPGMASLYWWEGVLQTSDECVLIFKTRASLVATLTDAVKAEHSYKCPCIVALPIVGGNADYLRWLGDETVATAAA